MKFLLLRSVLIVIGCEFCRSEYQGKNFPKVVTPLGTIEGLYNTSSGGKLYEAYLGIPYAKPITKKQRFEIAQPITPWTGVLSAKSFGQRCIQIKRTLEFPNTPTVIGAEDCLYSNVYTPTTKCKSKAGEVIDLLPVIIFIHGGSFQVENSADYEPIYIMDKPVILVTFNYRLGPFGFLSTEDDTVLGNMGLKDQVILLRWVQDNIRYFCGNPKKVTLIGQGAGGASVHFHYLTKLSKGLFQRGMSISSNALDPVVLTRGNLEKAKKLATILGCPSCDVRKMVDCLKTRPAEDITLAVQEFMVWVRSPPNPFGPAVEYGKSHSKFIHQQPIDSIITGEVHDLPWIATWVSEGGLMPAASFIANTTLLEELNKNWEKIAPHLLAFNYTIPVSEHDKISYLIRKHYFKKSPIENSTVEQIIRMLSDRLWKSNGERAVKLQGLAMKSPVTSYYFSYRGAHSSSEVFSGTNKNWGVMHFDDVAYVLKRYFDPTTTQRDREMQKVLINIWVSFARDGVPKAGVKWPRLNPNEDGLQYLHIAGPDNIYMDKDLNFGDKKFWNSIPFQENIISRRN